MRKRSEANAIAAAVAMGVEAMVSPDPNANPPIPEGVVAKPPPLIMSPHKGPGLSPDVERIIETLYRVDAAKEYEELERNLEIGDERGDYRTLQVHLDKAEDRARRAHKLFLSGKLERRRWELDADVVKAGLRKRALEELEADKRAGKTKRIANADVDATIAEMFPDEWRAQELRRTQLKGMEEALERLADLWKQRCYTLSTLMTTLRR